VLAARRRPATLSVVVVVVGLAVTAALSALAYVANSRNEKHLLQLQTGQAAAVVQQLVATVQTPLMSAAEVAEASNGYTGQLAGYVDQFTGKNKPFAAVSLWQLNGTGARLVRTFSGTAPPATPQVVRFVRSASQVNELMVGGQELAGRNPALWYAATARVGNPHYAMFARAALPPGRRIHVAPSSPFSELHFAIYLGKTVSAENLLEADVRGVPDGATTAQERVPFGTSVLTVVATPAQRLGGRLSADLWWLLALAGVILTALAALTAERLTRRRVTADRLRGRVETLLGEQRSIAESLQRALLPRQLPAIAGVDVAARYVPGTVGTEIGGDWYEVVPQADDCIFVVIGDVSGRGIPAATVMASLRFAIRGFITEGHTPDEVLTAAARLLDLRTDRHFATVLCGIVDLRTRQLTVASAGHLPPVLGGASPSIPRIAVDPPIGVGSDVVYRSTTIDLPASGVLLLFTDGLVERRGEDLDAGLARLTAQLGEQAAGAPEVDRLLENLVAQLIPSGATDDTAVVGMAWR
jgi:serine phosphatase RsbU (regulator of sigma subunit)